MRDYIIPVIAILIIAVSVLVNNFDTLPVELYTSPLCENLYITQGYETARDSGCDVDLIELNITEIKNGRTPLY